MLFLCSHSIRCPHQWLRTAKSIAESICLLFQGLMINHSSLSYPPTLRPSSPLNPHPIPGSGVDSVGVEGDGGWIPPPSARHATFYVSRRPATEHGRGRSRREEPAAADRSGRGRGQAVSLWRPNTRDGGHAWIRWLL